MGIPQNWRLKKQRYALVGEVCWNCNSKLFPPRDVCPKYNASAMAPFIFSIYGGAFSYSAGHQAPANHQKQAIYT